MLLNHCRFQKLKVIVHNVYLSTVLKVGLGVTMLLYVLITTKLRMTMKMKMENHHLFHQKKKQVGQVSILKMLRFGSHKCVFLAMLKC